MTIYVVAKDGCVLHRAKTVENAANYVVRRHALKGYLALRAGFPPNNFEPVKIMVRSGRKLDIGARADKPAGKWLASDGKCRTGKQAKPMEIACVPPEVLAIARDALRQKFPNTWRRHEESLR